MDTLPSRQISVIEPIGAAFEKTPLKQALTGNHYVFKEQQSYNQLSLFNL